MYFTIVTLSPLKVPDLATHWPSGTGASLSPLGTLLEFALALGSLPGGMLALVGAELGVTLALRAGPVLGTELGATLSLGAGLPLGSVLGDRLGAVDGIGLL